MEGLEAWYHGVDLLLAGEDRAPDVACPGGPVASRDLVDRIPGHLQQDQTPKVRPPQLIK